MKQTFYGYARVSSVNQNDDRQRLELEKWGILAKNIYADKVSGKDFNRPAYQLLRDKMQPGDVLVVKSIDRLGRNYEEIQNEWNYLVKEKNVDIVIIDMPILDTRTNKDLIGTLISDIVLQLLSYVAQTERDFIRQRQAEGIAAAKLKGIHLGRLPKPMPEGFDQYYQQWQNKQLSFDEMANKLGVTSNQLKWLITRKRRQERKS